MAILSLPQNREKVAYFAGIDGFRFKRPVVPGDTLNLEVTLERVRGPIGKGTARASIDGETAPPRGRLTLCPRRPAQRPGCGGVAGCLPPSTAEA